jgi:AbrB family looped-hinge helix DNA binding protein
MKIIVKTTSRGQITLPAKWRRSFDTQNFILEEKNDVLEIRPLKKEILEKEEYTVFDAIRDNKGKGIKSEDLVKVLEELE